MVDFFWHLGHPVVSEGEGKAAYRKVWEKLKPIIDHFNAQPLPLRAWIMLNNAVLVPKLCCTPK